MKCKLIIWLLLLTAIVSCKTSQEISGKYRSNFASLGFFMTEIDLNPNGNFHYVFSGDLVHTELDGIYRIKNNRLYLRFNKLKEEFDQELIEIDENNDTIVDFSSWQNRHSYDLKEENNVDYHLKYKIRKNKLQSYHIETGKVVRRAKYFTDKRKFLIIGPRYYKKRWFLRKRNTAANKS